MVVGLQQSADFLSTGSCHRAANSIARNRGSSMRRRVSMLLLCTALPDHTSGQRRATLRLALAVLAPVIRPIPAMCGLRRSDDPVFGERMDTGIDVRQSGLIRVCYVKSVPAELVLCPGSAEGGEECGHGYLRASYLETIRDSRGLLVCSSDQMLRPLGSCWRLKFVKFVPNQMSPPQPFCEA